MGGCSGAGGIAGLAGVIVREWAACESDFARFYGLSLAEVIWGQERITARRLLVLFRHLPEGAVTRALGAWPDTVELQAQTLEHLDLMARLLFARFAGKQPPWVQLHVQRPGERREAQEAQEEPQPARREATPEELAVILELPLPGR